MNLSWDWLTWQAAIDAVQIGILYLAIYAILKAGRGSRFGQVLTGAGILFGVSIAFTYLFRFDVLARILQMLLLYLALSSVVIFQPEIRRILAAIGSLIFSEGSGTFDRKKVTPEMMTNAIFDLARVKIGALIALALLWRRLRTGKMGVDARNDVRALFLLTAAFALATLRKLFNDLDVVALLTAALTLGTALDYWKTRSRRRREAQAAELKRRKAEAARRRAFGGGGKRR